jgi:hypothetical protein
MGRASNRKKTMTRAERLGGERGRAWRMTLDLALHTTAYHEAGHITVAEALGHRVQYAWVDLRSRPDPYRGGPRVGYFEIDAPEWSRGTLSPADVQDPERWRYMYSRLIVATAGLVSEEAYCTSTGLPYYEDLVSDQEEMHALCMLLAGVPDGAGAWAPEQGCAIRLMRVAPGEAALILQERWSTVGALAAALVARTDLTGDEVRATLAEAGGLRPALHVDWPSPVREPSLVEAVP